MIDIRTFRSKKSVRVDIYRKHRYTNAEGKIQFKNKMLGSFSLARGYKSTLSEKLETDEQLQLQNWLADAQFADQFDAEPDDLYKDAIRLPKNLSSALEKIYIEAKTANIDFIPHKIMLDALFKKAKAVQKQIDKSNKFSSNILENFGIDTGGTANDPD